MRRIAPVLLVILILFLGSNCIAQNQSRITNPTIELRDQKLIITYDLLESSSVDRFHVRLEVTDSVGNQLDVSALEGDVGINVTGGNSKRIYWDINADGVYIDADIYIQIYADKIPPMDYGGVVDAGADYKEFNRTVLVLQSVAFPGWGLSRVKGGPHWLKGMAGYGCIAGSIAFNRMAIATYEEYKTPESADDATNLLNKSIQQDNTSQILAYSAIGIWVADFIWTIVGTSDFKKTGSAYKKGITIGTDYDMLSHSPMLAVRYRF